MKRYTSRIALEFRSARDWAGGIRHSVRKRRHLPRIRQLLRRNLAAGPAAQETLFLVELISIESGGLLSWLKDSKRVDFGVAGAKLDVERDFSRRLFGLKQEDRPLVGIQPVEFPAAVVHDFFVESVGCINLLDDLAPARVKAGNPVLASFLDVFLLLLLQPPHHVGEQNIEDHALRLGCGAVADLPELAVFGNGVGDAIEGEGGFFIG